MKNFKNIITLLAVALMGLSLTACSKDNLDTNQYQGGVALNVYGPSPVMRGGQLRFLGSNLDQVREVLIPEGISITNIDVVKSGVPSEIRVTIPKDGPIPGKVVLITKTDERITTKTDLNYIEGIEITNIPVSAMPGDVIKIEGDYLNLIQSLAFAKGIVVSEADFKSHSRYAIEVEVPEEAQTGKLELYTADLTVVDKNKVEYQIIETEKAIEIGTPTISNVKGRNTAEALGNITAKAGETITVTGTYFNVIADITVGGVSVSDLKIANDGKGVTFTLPAEAPDGDILLVCKSGIEVPVGTLTTVKPTNCVATPNPVKAGQALQIDGKDMDLVTDVVFADSKGEYTIANNQNIINTKEAYAVTVPETATEGNLKLAMANGSRIDVPFTLVKPTVTGYSASSVSAGGQLTINGTNLDLVKKVQFGESDVVEVKGTAEAITLTVPMSATSGAPTLTLANGTTVANVPEVNIAEAVFCYITELPSDDHTPDAGSVVTVPVKNGDKLTHVTVNGNEVKFVYDEKNSQVTFGIPADAGSTVSVKFISSNGDIEYSMKVIPATSVERIVFTGPIVVDWNGTWPEGRIFITLDQLADVPANAVMHIEFTQHEAWGQVQINYGDWSQIPFEGTVDGGYLKPEIFNDKSVTEIDLPFTQEILDNIKAKNGDNGAIIIQGQDWTINKISIKWEISLEKDLAGYVSNMDGTPISYPYTFTWDDTGRFSLSKDLLLELGVKKGSKLLFYKDKSVTGQIQINNSSWTAIYYQTDWNAEKEVLEQEFDDALMEAVNNGGLVLQGGISGITKMTILP